MKNLLIELGDRVRLNRLEKGVSQEELAHICGFDRTYISLIERGRRNPSTTNLIRIARGLEVEPGTLLNDLPTKENHDG